MLEQHIGLRLITPILLIQYDDAFFMTTQTGDCHYIEASKLEPDSFFKIQNFYDCDLTSYLYLLKWQWYFQLLDDVSFQFKEMS